MPELIHRETVGDLPVGKRLVASVFVTDRSDGDLSISTVDDVLLAQRRSTISPLSWTWLRQVHSDRVVTVREPGGKAGTVADAAVTATAGVTLAAHTADCVPVAIISPAGGVAAAHAGWRGLQLGVLESTARALLAEVGGSPSDLRAVVGPHVCAACYEFGQDELATLEAQFGRAIRSTTSSGTAALDLATAVDAELGRIGIEVTAHMGCCTSCEADRFWSHRARAESGRQALVVTLEAE